MRMHMPKLRAVLLAAGMVAWVGGWGTLAPVVAGNDEAVRRFMAEMRAVDARQQWVSNARLGLWDWQLIVDVGPTRYAHPREARLQVAQYAWALWATVTQAKSLNEVQVKLVWGNIDVGGGGLGTGLWLKELPKNLTGED